MAAKKKGDAAIVTKIDENTTVITSEKWEADRIANAIATYDPQNRQYSAQLGATATADTLTPATIAQYATTAQTDVDTAIRVNGIIRKYVNMDDLLGMVAQAVSTNINTEYRLSYNNFGTQRNKAKTLEKTKALIDDFNKQINIRQLIRNSIDTAYNEGTYICLLRNDAENWIIDNYPLGVAEISGYRENGRPVVLVNIAKLREALQKTMIKTKNGKPLFFKDTKEEVKANYPKEVYDAYVANETYARLDTQYTGVVRINNRGFKYGLSPMFRALNALVTLDAFNTSDAANAKAKARKIIHQILRKEVMGTNGERKGLEMAAYAHTQFIQAFAKNTVVYTSPPAVEKIEYVEPKTEDVHADKVNLYRMKVLSSLGVSFLADSGDIAANTAKLSLKQLLQQINAISEQTEDMIKHFYETLLTVNNIGLEYLPSIKVIDSEMLEMDLKMELAKLLYSTFACSRETSMGFVGIDLVDEKARREKENTDGLDEIFKPYVTSFTTNGDDDGGDGRPKDKESNDPNKQEQDEVKNE